jgi:hypothetical protein
MNPVTRTSLAIAVSIAAAIVFRGLVIADWWNERRARER